jgi:phage terminase large subunit-like protein
VPGYYRLDKCAFCGAQTWCEQRANGKPQCRACKVERFFDGFLYPPLGYSLLYWQRDLLRALYGTVDEFGIRRYRQAYISVAKKQGKSFFCAGLPLYHLIMEFEEHSEAYGAAAAKDQAGIVFRSCLQLIRANPVLMQRLKVLESTKRILRRDGAGSYVVLSADGDVQDGIEPSLAIIDELHRWRTKKAETLHDVITKGTISRAESLVIQVTTAGEEHEAPLWFREHEYARHILDGSLRSDSFYAAIWSADAKRMEADPEYWKSREARVAANPSHEDHGGFLKDVRLVEEMNKAVDKPETRKNYLRYHLNIPVAEGETPIIDMDTWRAGGGGIDLRTWPEYDVELLISKLGLMDRPCYCGIDCSWTTDMTAASFLFPPADDSERWKALIFHWLPEERIPDLERRTRAPLSHWVKQGFLTAVPGQRIDLREVEKKVKWAAKLFDVREICFDPWGMAQASLNLVDEGFLCVEVRQGYQTLSKPTKKLIELYTSKQFEHCNNPILNWEASCLALLSDGSDNVKPSKPARDAAAKRIDGIAATITAMVRAMLGESNTISYTGVQSVG